jgi:hypothetical protein
MAERQFLTDSAALDALLAKQDGAIAPAGLAIMDASLVDVDVSDGVLIRLPWLTAPESTGKSIIAVRGKLPLGFTMPWRGKTLPFSSSILTLYTPIRGARG